MIQKQVDDRKYDTHTMTQKTAQQSMTTFNFKMNVTFFKELIRWKRLSLEKAR